MLVVTELFIIAVSNFDAKKATRHSQVLVVTEVAVSGTQGNSSNTAQLASPSITEWQSWAFFTL